MKKRNYAVILAVLATMLIVFAACGEGNKDDKKDDATDSVAFEEVTVLQTDANGEVVTDAQGNPSYITVT